MLTISPNTIPCHVQVVNPDTAEITFTMPVKMVRPFKMFIESLTEMFAGISWKIRTDENQIKIRNEAQVETVELEYQKYADFVVSTYQHNLLSGLSPQDAFKHTTRSVKVVYANSSYDRVRNILIKSGAFKKSNFYEKKT